MEKKFKKHEKILDELVKKRETNDKYCNQNNCEPTDYMLGANNVLDEMIEFVGKLTNK